MTDLEDLKDGYEDYLEGAGLVEEKGNYKSSVNLYFKALTSLVDYILKKRKGRVPDNHGERFRMTEDEFTEVYRILDSIFGTYRDSYTEERGEKHVRRIKNGIRKIIQDQGLEEEFEVPH